MVDRKSQPSTVASQGFEVFPPLVALVGGVMAKEHTAATKRLATLLTQKWGHHYLEVYGFLQSCLSFTLTRSSSRMLQAECYHKSFPQTLVNWESGESLWLYMEI